MTHKPDDDAALVDYLFEFLCRKYVQRADARQKAMGLQYTEAETHDLAKEIARAVAARLTAGPQDMREALERARSLCDQVRVDLGSAHAEICKLQGLDPATHSWPTWSSPANTLRWIDDKLIPLFDHALTDTAPRDEVTEADRLRADLAKWAEHSTACEQCGAPLFDGDDYVTDPDGVAGCWAAMTDAPSQRDRPCYAYRVGQRSANDRAMTAARAQNKEQSDG